MATRATLATVPSAAITAPETVVPFNTPAVTYVQVGINVTALSGTTPSLQAYLEVLGSDGVWYQVWKPSAITAVGQTVTTLGPNAATGAVWSNQARLRLELTGTTPSVTLSADVHGI